MRTDPHGRLSGAMVEETGMMNCEAEYCSALNNTGIASYLHPEQFKYASPGKSKLTPEKWNISDKCFLITSFVQILFAL